MYQLPFNGESMKVVHLSDLHIGYVNGKWNCADRATAIISAIIEKCQPASEYVVVITGDLVDKGKIHDQINHAANIIDALGKSSIKCIVVPGNHDYGSGLGISLRHQAYFKKTFYGKSDESFPRLTIIGDTAFLSLDSLQGEFDLSGNILDGGTDLTGGADGCIGPNQLEVFRAMLSSPEVRRCSNSVVLLHHHPLYKAAGFLELKDAGEFTSVLEEYEIDMLLFGHKHGGDELNSNWGIPRVFDGGSSTGKDMEVPSKIRVVDLTKPPSQYATVPWNISFSSNDVT